MRTAAEVSSPDQVLTDRARRGERGAFDALVVRYQARAYRLAWRMTRSGCDAEEIVQEAFFSAHRALGSFHGEAQFGTWLYRIVVNEALMRRRSAARRPTLSLEELPAQGDDASADPNETVSVDVLLDEKRLTQEVREALGGLDDVHRRALVLRDLEGLSSEEVAEILGVNAEAVRQRAHRARVKLRALLGHLADAA